MTVRYGVPRRRAKAGLRKWAILATLLAVLPARAAHAAPVRLLIFGDSLVAGYGLPVSDAFQAQLLATLRAHGRDVTLLDGGVSGDTSAGGLARLDWALGDKPDAVFLELGANDALRGTDPAETYANLSAILDKLATAHLPVLLSGMEAPPNLGAAYGRQYRAVFAKLGARPGIIFDPFFLAGVAGDPVLNQGDHMHPNAQGVKREVARITPLVERLVDQARK